MANTLATIERNSDTFLWHYIPSEFNPADVASQRAYANATSKLQEWIDGPQFLREFNPQPFPNKLQVDLTPSDFALVRKQENYSCLKVDKDVIDKLIERCSTLTKLKRLTAWIRYTTNLRDKTCNKKLVFNVNLFAGKLRHAYMALACYLQHQHFPDFCLGAVGKLLTSLPPSLRKLNTIAVEGVWRAGGRLGGALVELEVKHPALLQSFSHFIKLVIHHHHAKVGHSVPSHPWASLLRN